MFFNMSSEDYSGLLSLIQYFFYFMGVMTVGHGLWKMIEASAPGQQHGTLGLRSVILGGCLMAVGPLVGYVSNGMGLQLTDSQFSQVANFNNVQPFSAADYPNTTAHYGMLVSTFINLLVVFGYWCVGKGLLMFKKTSDGVEQSLDEGALSAITHIFFGCMLVNIRIIVPSIMIHFLGFNASMVAKIFGVGSV